MYDGMNVILPPMKGSPAQIRWAQSIRRELIDNPSCELWIYLNEKAREFDYEKMLKKILRMKTTAEIINDIGVLTSTTPTISEIPLDKEEPPCQKTN